MRQSETSEVEFRHVTKRCDEIAAVDGIRAPIRPGTSVATGFAGQGITVVPR